MSRRVMTCNMAATSAAMIAPISVAMVLHHERITLPQ
jgi:hypothetical protein